MGGIDLIKAKLGMVLTSLMNYNLLSILPCPPQPQVSHPSLAVPPCFSLSCYFICKFLLSAMLFYLQMGSLVMIKTTMQVADNGFMAVITGLLPQVRQTT